MFSGFSKETGEFLWELAFNNERPWFQSHKETFERVLNEPFKALAHDTYEELCTLLPEEGFSVHVSRIYRDARRLFGRGPYKDHLWFTFTPAGAADYGPAFWFQIGASDYSYGLGFWAPTSAYMEAFRRAIAANPAAFERLVKGITPMKGFFGAERDHDALLFSSELPRRVAADWARLMPMCRFMIGAVQGVTPPKAEKR